MPYLIREKVSRIESLKRRSIKNDYCISLELLKIRRDFKIHNYSYQNYLKITRKIFLKD